MRVELNWLGEQRFAGRASQTDLVLDGNASAGPSPVEALALALAGCMGMDLVHILTKGRQEPKAVRAVLEAERTQVEPRRIVAARLRFTVTGDVPAEKVERAIALSREKYCSVWHSLRPDIAFETSFEVRPV
ncbi:MAG TPA: OsmC family protein [Vicinamibacteria bacterium]